MAIIHLPPSPSCDTRPMQTSACLSPLPVELIIRILSFLPFKDIVICSGVSCQFREIIDTSSTLEYILELGLCGLIDSVQDSLTTAERLCRLRERENAWSSLRWRSTWKVLVAQKYTFWELCGGLFVGAFVPRNNSSASRQGRAFNTIDIFDLEVRTTDGPTRQMALEKTFFNFSIDSGQDLLILVEEPPPSPSVVSSLNWFINPEAIFSKVWIMHIRSLSSGLAHLGATQPTIQISVAHETWPASNGFPGDIDTQILGCVVLCSQRRGPGNSGSISVIDWTTGTEIFLVYPALGDWCCTLLSETELLILERASFRSQPSLEIYHLHGPSKWKAPRITFLLPFQSAERIWRPVHCYSPASFTAGQSRGRPDTSPFRYPPTPHLLAFRFTSTTANENGRGPLSINLDMFLLVDQLRRHVHYGDVVPWEVWGPQSTRTFRAVLPNIWRRNIHGYRAILPDNNTVLDFNSNLWTAGDPGVVTQSSHISLDSQRGLVIVSSLPYRELRPPQPFGHKYITLSDNIVCIEGDVNDGRMTKAIHVLSF